MSRSTAIVEYRAAVGKLPSTPANTERLRVAWDLFTTAHPMETVGLFVKVVNVTTEEEPRCEQCTVCELPEWLDNGYSDVECNFVCDECRGNYAACDRCGDFGIDNWNLTTVRYMTNWCDKCRDSYANWCEYCDEYFTDGNADEHHHDDDEDDGGCDCEPQSLHFQILANSHGVLHEDERLLVTLPQGDITDEAVSAVIQILWDAQFRALNNDEHWMERYNALDAAIRSLQRSWQTREGNYTRRVSKVLYQQFGGVKLEPGLLSRVGSTVRDYSGRTNQWYVEFTRDLNQSASAFYHSGSCWWGSDYGRSRCALKHWGGLALRTYQTEDQRRDMPSGRAWVQPLNDQRSPTTDIFKAHSYVVYNGYGDLDGYTPARLLAYLTSRTYKKIDFSASSQYVNSGGYLVADQPTCDAVESVSIYRDYHQAVSA